MIRSLYVKLLLSAMLVVGLLMALLVSLEYDSYRNEQAKFIQQELQRDLSRLFSTTVRPPPRASAAKAFSTMKLDWPNRLVDGVVCDVNGELLWQDIAQVELLTVRKLCQGGVEASRVGAHVIHNATISRRRRRHGSKYEHLFMTVYLPG